MAKTNKQLQAEIDELIIERNNLIDKIDTLEGNIDFIKSKLKKNMDDKENYYKQLHYILLLLGYEFKKDAPKFIGDKEYKFIETKINLLIEFKDKHDEQFKTIINYEKELEKQDKEIEELKEENHDLDTMVINMKEKIKELEEQKKDDWRLEQYNELNTKLRKTREEQDKEIDELKDEIAGLNESNKYLATVQLDYEKEIKELKELVDEKTVEINRNNSGWRKSICGNQRIKIIELEKSVKGLDEMCEKRRSDYFKLEEKYEQCFEELSTKLSEESDLDIIRAENEVIKQDKANLLAELTKQINEKQELRNKNRKLTKRRRSGRYNIDKFITNLTKGAYVYVEGASRPTKLHKRLTDAIAEKQRLEKKTGKKVYILTNL